MVAQVGESNHTVRILEGGQRVEVDGRSYSVDLSRTSDGTTSLLLDGRSFQIHTTELHLNGGDNSFSLNVNGSPFVVTIEDYRSQLRKRMFATATDSKSAVEVKAPMPGKVVAIEVRVDEKVVPGKGLFILEAMKMENEIRSNAAGCVDSIRVRAGQSVEKDEIILSIKHS